MATTKKYQDGGTTRFEKRQAKKVAKAKTRAAVAEIEGEGTVAQKRNNRADRAAKVLGTARAKSPRRLSTSTSTSNVDNRNSGNTNNVTNSGSTSAGGSSSSGSSSGSGVDQSRRRSDSTSVRQTQVNNRNRTNNTSVRQSQDNSTTNYTDKSKTTNVSKTKYTDNSSRTNNSRRNTQIGAGNTSTKNSNFKKGGAMKKMKTGGMVNANAKVSKQTVPGSKGVKSGVNPRAAASKVAKGRSGGTSAAPKTAVPRAKYGMAMRKK